MLNVPGKKSRDFIYLGKDDNVTRTLISQDVQPTENYFYLTEIYLHINLNYALI